MNTLCSEVYLSTFSCLLFIYLLVNYFVFTLYLSTCLCLFFISNVFGLKLCNKFVYAVDLYETYAVSKESEKLCIIQ